MRATADRRSLEPLTSRTCTCGPRLDLCATLSKTSSNLARSRQASQASSSAARSGRRSKARAIRSRSGPTAPPAKRGRPGTLTGRYSASRPPERLERVVPTVRRSGGGPASRSRRCAPRLRKTRAGSVPRKLYAPPLSPPSTLSRRKPYGPRWIFRNADTGVSRSARISRQTGIRFPRAPASPGRSRAGQVAPARSGARRPPRCAPRRFIPRPRRRARRPRARAGGASVSSACSAVVKRPTCTRYQCRRRAHAYQRGVVARPRTVSARPSASSRLRVGLASTVKPPPRAPRGASSRRGRHEARRRRAGAARRLG